MITNRIKDILRSIELTKPQHRLSYVVITVRYSEIQYLLIKMDSLNYESLTYLDNFWKTKVTIIFRGVN